MHQEDFPLSRNILAKRKNLVVKLFILRLALGLCGALLFLFFGESLVKFYVPLKLYSYHFFHRCAFLNTHFLRTPPLQNVAEFRLLALGDLQLEGDSPESLTYGYLPEEILIGLGWFRVFAGSPTVH